MDSGPHTLQVRAVLPGSDRVSAPTRFSFTVSRPWYQTWWALLLAVATLGAVAWTSSELRRWRSARTEQRLRALVDERTLELSGRTACWPSGTPRWSASPTRSPTI